MTESLNRPTGKKICSVLIVLAFVLMFAVSITTADDYGLPYDEPTEIEILLMNVRSIADRALSADNLLSYSLNDRGVPAITDSVERDHGQAAYYPFALYILKVTNMCMDDVEYYTVSNAYHLYTTMICFTAVVALYFIALGLTGSQALAMLSALMLFVTPRFFGEFHYNNKDIVLLCLLIDMSLFALRAIKGRKLWDGMLFALLAALAANTKIIGVFFFGVLGLAYLIYITVKKQWNRRSILVAVGTIFSFCLFYYVLTPAMWNSPADFFRYCMDNAFQFSRHTGAVLFQGRVLQSALGEVPRYYLIKYIAITTPVFVLMLAALGLIRLVRKGTDKETYGQGEAWEKPFFVLALCVSALVPLVISSISKSVVYNGWRHFYFSYFGVLILALYGLEPLWKKYKKVTSAAMAVLLATTGVLLAANHPYEFSYFNVLVGSNAHERYETDYWGLSAVDGLRLVLDDAESEMTTVSYLDTESGHRILWALVMLSQEEQNRISIVNDVESAEYIVENVGYQIIGDGLDVPEGFYLYKTIDAYGNKLVNIYKRG